MYNKPLLISAENLVVKGDGGAEIINVPHLEIEQGFTAIVGPSGSGKSTLLNSLVGLRTLSSGVIRHYDAEGFVSYTHSKKPAIGSSQTSEYRSKMTGYIAQNPHLDAWLTPTQQIYDQHAVRGNKLDVDYVNHLIDSLDISTIFEKHSPKFLGNIRPSRERLSGVLSGGEKQRLAVAVALAHMPYIVFGDEPASALGTKHKKPLYELLRNTVDVLGNSVVIVSHDPNVFDFTDQVIYVEDGVVVQNKTETDSEKNLYLPKRTN